MKEQKYEIAHLSNSFFGDSMEGKPMPGFSFETAEFIAGRINSVTEPYKLAEVFALDDGHTPTFGELQPSEHDWMYNVMYDQEVRD